MEIYSTEEQQVEAIKSFWKEYGTSILVGAVVGLGGLYGWNTYSDMKVAKAEAASMAYQQLSANTSDEAAMLKAAEGFKAEHDQQGYSLLVEMMVAKSAVEAKDYAKAEESLKKVIAAKDAGSLGSVAALRLARIQAEQGQGAVALTTLDAITDTAFEAQRDEIKGDILTSQGETDKAKAAYQAALDKGGISASPLLKMKLDNLNQA
ncbi:tetratricopeptide repeat protein [Shewanella litorisediminis]|uniref:Ancillary SecYEG translocon subunit n=1 Tax=Shewanella litorisediminis TaxID=1173586 RepID=A0ABX7G092_9GAMM|nr:tetratricopeptide repeat protein [Shewanella litorisediminis]MCL2918314.1 tetratricopeptide repeat protein [Shewanella litorisediminis]QRH00637.1 tetratricopeptide repeat protein [Shewanella litorisediminis]